MTTPGSHKTALCIPSFTFGGAEMQAFLLARIMHSKDINVEIIALGRKGELIKEIEKEGISWSHFPMNSLTSGSRISRLLSFLKFIRFLKHRKIHTLIGYTYHPNIWCGAAWRRAGIRHFYWNQRSAADEMPVSRIEKMAISSAPGYIANATAGADFISKRHGVPLEKIRIIHNGLYLKPSLAGRKEWRERLGIGEEVFMAVMSANFFPEKDYKTLIRAWKKVSDASSQQLLLVITGVAPGSSTAMLESVALSFELSLCGKLVFLGHNEDNAGLFRAADLGILSSLSEGLPNVVLEYMGCGLPVVLSDIPGNREAFGVDLTQTFFETGNDSELAERIIYHSENKTERKARGEQNKIRAEKMFSTDLMSESYFALPGVM